MSEPTLRESLHAINGLGARLDRVEQKVDNLANMAASLACYPTRAVRAGAPGAD